MLETVGRHHVHELHADVLAFEYLVGNGDGIFDTVVTLLDRGDALGNLNHALLIVLGLEIEFHTVELVGILLREIYLEGLLGEL